MAPPRGSSHINTAYSVSILSEYTHILESLPLELSRNFADLRELDAVLSSSMSSITSKITTLTQMIEDGNVPKEERLWLLNEIATEATRLKPGGEDKIRVACQAADNLRSHTNHLRTLLEHLPSFDAATLNRDTTYPHVASRSYMPAASLDSRRGRMKGFSSLLVTAPEPSPPKRKRITREDDMDIAPMRSPRKEKVVEPVPKPRNGARVRRTERAESPTGSLPSVASHIPAQPINGNSRVNSNSSRTANTNGSSSNKRSRASNNHQSSSVADPVYQHEQNPRRDVFNAPPSSSSSHPSLPLPYGVNSNGAHNYDRATSLSSGADWVGGHPPQHLEGPGMPVARGQSHHASSLPASSNIAAPNPPAPSTQAAAKTSGAAEGTPADGGDGDGEGDDRTYCICDGISYGEMIACDEITCEREWFHLACIGLTTPPDGAWYCDTCKTKRNAKRGGRGGKRRVGVARTGAKAN